MLKLFVTLAAVSTVAAALPECTGTLETLGEDCTTILDETTCNATYFCNGASASDVTCSTDSYIQCAFVGNCDEDPVAAECKLASSTDLAD